MAINVVSIIHEQEAMLGQLGFLKNFTTALKMFPPPQEIDKNDINQLILTIYYLKEGLENLYIREDNYMLSNLELSNSSEIKYKHKEIINSLHGIYRLLIDIDSKTPLTKEYISDAINNLCQLVSSLSIQENEIFQSYSN